MPRICFVNKMDRVGASYERTIESIRRRTQPRSGHMLNFIECMRSRELPHLHADAGYRVMTTIGLAVEAFRENRVKLFDPVAEDVV